MKIGDLVSVKRSDSDIRSRDSGIIIKFDTYTSTNPRETIPIAEVLWSSGLSWIDSSRIEMLKK